MDALSPEFIERVERLRFECDPPVRPMLDGFLANLRGYDRTALSLLAHMLLDARQGRLSQESERLASLLGRFDDGLRDVRAQLNAIVKGRARRLTDEAERLLYRLFVRAAGELRDRAHPSEHSSLGVRDMLVLEELERRGFVERPYRDDVRLTSLGQSHLEQRRRLPRAVAKIGWLLIEGGRRRLVEVLVGVASGYVLARLGIGP